MLIDVDILVAGAGAAGLAASVSAARAGAATLLVDRASGPGGTGGFSGLTTLCGLFDENGQYLNDGFAREFAEAIAAGPPRRMGRVWVLPYQPARFREVAERLLSSTPRLHTRWDWPVRDVALDKNRIASVHGVSVRAVIDCTGSAEVARAAGIDCLATDSSTQAPAVVFSLTRVDRVLDDLAGAAAVLLPVARAGFEPLTIQPGSQVNTVTVKFTGPPGRVPELIQFLRDRIPGFARCEPIESAFRAWDRAGRMILGEYVLTGADVRTGARFEDAVARGAWPIEQWNEAGVARMEYLSQGRGYEIPARCLRARDVANLFMAGKTISADVEAIASARVMGCCLATGAAAGQLAATPLHSGL